MTAIRLSWSEQRRSQQAGVKRGNLWAERCVRRSYITAMPRGYRHIPWHDTPVPGGIQARLRRLGLSQPWPRFVAMKKWVENLRRKQELGTQGSLNTAVGAALCCLTGATLWDGALRIRSRFFKLIVCVVASSVACKTKRLKGYVSVT